MTSLRALPFIISTLIFITACTYTPEKTERESEADKMMPSDWMYYQRAYPVGKINTTLYRDEFHRIQAMKAIATRDEQRWEMVGPTNIGGRITDLALHPRDTNIIYVGAATGGIFKSEDKGVTWQSIFDDAGSLSIGDLALAPSNPDIVYVGTGEANGSAMSGSFAGDGMYKSVDAGQTWTHIGLEKSEHIARVVVDDKNPDRVYVAAMGTLYGTNAERGLYRTLDGGESWENVLFVSDSTGCIDVVVHPQDANIVYAATWERQRRPWQRDYAGVTSRVYRSQDGGDTWEQLSNGLPSDDPDRGRIGLAISASNPKIMYALYTTDPITNVFDEIYKSVDGGDSWQEMPSFALNGMYSSFGWYFGNLRIDPNHPDIGYVLAINLFKTTDGGQTWRPILNGMHVDQHALEAHPMDSEFVVAGNDGGVYLSENGGQSWRHVQVLPVTQFYNCEVSQSQSEVYFGGTQDNGTVRTVTGEQNSWQQVLGGDGFHVVVDPFDSNYVYAEYQWGNIFRSTNGGTNFQRSDNGISNNDRTNWNTPVVIDPLHPATLYYGANRLYRTTNRASNWEAISGDLTKGLHQSGSTSYGTITSIAVSPKTSNIIYVGTDDGNVQVSLDYGESWELVSENLPNRYVTEVAADPRDSLTGYVTFSGFRSVDYLPHIFKTEDAGQTWQDISGNLPEVPVNDIIIDPDFENTYYVATDLGVWYTYNGGMSWSIFGENLPTTIVSDLAWHIESRTLVAGTYGRSMYKIQPADPPMVSAVQQVEPFVDFSVSPNPANTFATVQIQMKTPTTAQFQLFDQNGRFLQMIENRYFPTQVQQFTFDTQRLPAGSYVLRLQTARGHWAKQLQVVH